MQLLPFIAVAAVVVVTPGVEVFGRPGVKRILDRVSGLVLIGLGIRIAFEHRH